MVDSALARGYNVCWGGDVSNKGFTRQGLAVEDTIPSQQLRQQRFDQWETTYDHVMLIYGTACDEQGEEYYLVKNSWGEAGDYRGIWYMNKRFLMMGTIYVMLNRQALKPPRATATADTKPCIEMQADRTMIYPQRMELTGEETLMDVLQMVPDLMIAGYEDVVTNYNLRIDNCPMNGDTRLILSQMKAKDIGKIQVCHNTGVAKGTIGTGRVLDINMKMPAALKGFVEGQGDMGREVEGIGAANALYGSGQTDLYANVSYRHQEGNDEYLTLHMTNRFDRRNRLLTYFTQQYLDRPDGISRKVLGRARFFHTFNDQGTELLLVGGYQEASDPYLCNKLPLVNVELNTPLFTERLSMMLGAEADFLMTSQKHSDRSWHVFNKDVYLQFTYALAKWRLTVGNRVLFYDYALKEEGATHSHADIRNNSNACVIFVPDSRNQLQAGYYRKYYNPAYEAFFMSANELSDEDWAMSEGRLEERVVNQAKLAYAHSRQKLTVQAEASYYAVEDGENFAELGLSAYGKMKWVTLTGGSNLYTAKSGTYASFRLAPTAYLPSAWQIGMQVVYYTRNSPVRELTGVPVYGCLSVNKQLGRTWHLGVDWHDMFDALCSNAQVNRHAANIKLQYRF
jgi:hypothetical protein